MYVLYSSIRTNHENCKKLDINLEEFKREELDLVLRKNKNRKAAGLDEITTEVRKTSQFDDILLRHSNAVYNQNTIDRWIKGCILPFHEKGDLVLTKNYWGITLTSLAAKIYNALLRNRIEPKIEKILRKNKNGFQKKSIHDITNVHYPPNSRRRYVQKTLTRQYHLSTSARSLTPYTEGIWSKYFSPVASPKKPSQP